MNYRILLIIALYLTCSLGASIIEEGKHWYKKEEINGHIFMQQLWASLHETKEEWSIDGQQVLYEVFAEKRLYESLQVLKKEQEAEYACLQAEKNKQEVLRKKVFLKLLSARVDQIVHYVRKSTSPVLIPYYYFDKTTVTQPEWLVLNNEILPAAKKYLFQEVTYDASSIKEIEERLEAYIPKLESFYEKTIHAAIEQCDDPVILKSLLELLEC